MDVQAALGEVHAFLSKLFKGGQLTDEEQRALVKHAQSSHHSLTKELTELYVSLVILK